LSWREEWLPLVVSFGWWEAGLDWFLAPFLFLLTVGFVFDIDYTSTANKEKRDG